MTVPGIIAGIGALGGGLQQQAASAAEAARNRRFQREMRETQYQTAVKDLRAAGLNPALAYMQGGAGNLSGSVGQMEGVGDVGGRAIEAAVNAKNLKLLDRQSELVGAQAQKVQSEKMQVDRERERLEQWLGHRGDGTMDPNSAFAAEIRAARARGESAELSLSEFRALSEMWDSLGSTGKGIEKFIVPILRIWASTRLRR